MGRIDLTRRRVLLGTGTRISDADGTWSVEQLETLTNQISDLLHSDLSEVQDQGFSHRILLSCENPAHALCGLLAILQVGAVAIPFSEKSGKSEEMLTSLLAPSSILAFEDGAPKLKHLSSDPSEKRSDIILTTTGSTGAPKGVCLNFDQLLLNAATTGSSIGMIRGIRWIINTDIALTSGLCHLLMAMLFECHFIHTPNMTDAEVAKELHGEYGFAGAPIQISNLADRKGTIDPPALLMSSGDFLTASVVTKIIDAFPDTRLHKVYGLTELSGRLCLMPANQVSDYPDAVGLPLPGCSLRLVDDDGSIIQSNEVGRIQARTPMLMSGYLTAENTFTPTGFGEWFNTGDLGRIAPDGFLTLMGRADFSFKVGGEKVDVFSVERALEPLFGARPFMVASVDHPILGSVPAIFVEETSQSTEGLWREIRQTVIEKLPTRFVPMYGYVAAELPRLRNGKLDRRVAAQNTTSYTRLS